MTASVRTVVKQVASTLKVPQAKILSDERESAAVAEARMVAMFVYKERNGHTNRQTAKAFGRKPPTVTHALRTIKKRMRNSTKFRSTVNALKANGSGKANGYAAA